jgi:hypothetical protein
MVRRSSSKSDLPVIWASLRIVLHRSVVALEVVSEASSWEVEVTADWGRGWELAGTVVIGISLHSLAQHLAFSFWNFTSNLWAA